MVSLITSTSACNTSQPAMDSAAQLLHVQIAWLHTVDVLPMSSAVEASTTPPLGRCKPILNIYFLSTYYDIIKLTTIYRTFLEFKCDSLSLALELKVTTQ